MAQQAPTFGFLALSGWHGATEKRVLVVGTTPCRVRIRALERTQLGGRGRWLEPGGEALVPKHAVRLEGSTP